MTRIFRGLNERDEVYGIATWEVLVGYACLAFFLVVL